MKVTASRFVVSSSAQTSDDWPAEPRDEEPFPRERYLDDGELERQRDRMLIGPWLVFDKTKMDFVRYDHATRSYVEV